MVERTTQPDKNRRNSKEEDEENVLDIHYW